VRANGVLNHVQSAGRKLIQQVLRALLGGSGFVRVCGVRKPEELGEAFEGTRIQGRSDSLR